MRVGKEEKNKGSYQGNKHKRIGRQRRGRRRGHKAGEVGKRDEAEGGRGARKCGQWGEGRRRRGRKTWRVLHLDQGMTDNASADHPFNPLV